MSKTFFGREQELKQLRQALEAAASPDADPRGPRIVFVVAETGYGKSRLVQELYHDLTQDPKWDPPESDFWPDAFGDRGEELSVNPSMSGTRRRVHPGSSGSACDGIPRTCATSPTAGARCRT